MKSCQPIGASFELLLYPVTSWGGRLVNLSARKGYSRSLAVRSVRRVAASNFLKISVVLATAVLVTGLVALVTAGRPAAAATLPSGFEDQLLASVREPTALAFTPDGRMLVATQPGQLRVYKNGQLLATPALDISSKICANSERGMLGVAIDPSFSTNKYVYLYYTYNKFGVCPINEPTNANNPVNRVSRFVMSGDTVDPTSEVVLIDNILSPRGTHNAGDLHFGKDGYLYVTVGDGGCDYNGDSGCAGANDASRDQHVLLGKVLRTTRDGGIPSTNPYTGTSSARCNITGRTDPGSFCQETFAWGLRNPFRFAFDPNATGTRFFINDVGQGAWEEVDEGKAGADYAWNLCEGSHDNPGRTGSVDCTASPYTPPVHEYDHNSTGCGAVTGGAFVPDGVWPASYNGSYLLGDYVCNKIFKLTPESGGGFTRTEFASELGGGGPTAMSFGPYGSSKALYYTTYANGGEVHLISYAVGNQSPTASLETTSPNYGPIPLTVSFDGSGSKDPDGDTPLTYLWDFGDETAPRETTTPTTSHTYTTVPTNSYTATLKVRDARGAVSSPATVMVFPGNTPPEPTIESPAPTKLFRVGEQVTLRGSASDVQDGSLADSALRWEVRQHHNGSHWHPFFSATDNNLTFNAPPPEDLSATSVGNYLEIRLTATDSKGLSKTVTQELQPHRVDVSFQSSPSELELGINGTTFTAPQTFVSWEGYKLNVDAPTPQTLSGKTYIFASWSDGKLQRHDIVTGPTPSTYTATFRACTKTGTSGDDVLNGTSSADVICGMGGNDTIRGRGGIDTVEGMAGNDALHGGGGADTVTGGTGADNLYGNDGNDTVNSKDGVSGNDNLDGGQGTDTKVTDATEKSIKGFP
jgi:glucose/arabinose dehydrogenase